MKMMGDVVVAAPPEGSLPLATSNQPSSRKEFRDRTLRSLKRGLGRLWKRHSGNVSITEYDPSYKVAYLGNVLTGWAKGDGCVEKPVTTLWRNYVSSSRPDVSMRLTVTSGGLTATTRDHGLTEYWAHRVTYCTAPTSHPRLVVWVYRHEGRRLRPELRCHAALCSTESTARRLATTLNSRLQQALSEFRRDKVLRQNARLSLANAVYENPSLPRRKILLSTGGQNYRPPLERSKSAPKLSAIEEDAAAEELEQNRLMEELRSLRNVACGWPEQDDWRLARFVEAFERGNSGEFPDENGSISSGCETASTTNSEERAPGAEDSNGPSDLEPRSPRRVYFADEAMDRGLSPRRNSEGSPNFMTCTGSPQFSNRSGNRKVFDDGGNSFEEDPRNVFGFDDPDDEFGDNDVVDCSPRGERPRRLSEGADRRLARMESYPPAKETNLHEDGDLCKLAALDEEVDSDESGYVEAPPAPFASQLSGQDDEDEKSSTEKTMDDTKMAGDHSRLTKDANGADSGRRTVSQNPEMDLIVQQNNGMQRIQCDLEKPDAKRPPTNLSHEEFKSSRCPISETIKKLANASLKTSKSLEISTNNCLKALNNLKSTKSFEAAQPNKDTVESSPSLHQRKQLLAQQGVKV